jgi:hypothetical protein
MLMVTKCEGTHCLVPKDTRVEARRIVYERQYLVVSCTSSVRLSRFNEAVCAAAAG